MYCYRKLINVGVVTVTLPEVYLSQSDHEQVVGVLGVVLGQLTEHSC